MLRKDILLIINPNASKGRWRRRAHEIHDLFALHGRACTVAYTREPGHAENLARRGASYGYKVIVAAGGDGTVNEVLNGIMKEGKKNVRMGIIPIGRGNDFAWIAGIPKNVSEAVKIIADGVVRPVDVGYCTGTDHPEGMYFLNGMGFGFEPMVNFRAMEYRRLNGMLSYAAAFISVLRNLPSPYAVHMVIDGEVFDIKTQQISVCSGRRMGSAFMMAPLAVIDDGFLDVMFTKHPLERRDLTGVVLSFFRGSHAKGGEHFAYMRARSVTIESAKAEIPAHSDGEVFTRSGSSFSVRILPAALELIRPEN